MTWKNDKIKKKSRPGRGHDRNEVLVYTKEDLSLDEELFEQSINITLPDKAQNNGTFYTRVVLAPTGKPRLGVQAFGRMIRKAGLCLSHV